MRSHIDLTVDLTPYKFKRAVNDFVDGLKYIGDHGEALIDAVAKETIKQVRTDLNKGYHDCIENFYNAYTPGSRKTSKNGKVYHRTYDLYNAYKIVQHGKYDISVQYGPEYMNGGHRAPNKDIYYLSFMRGAHGGAQSGPNHPSPGTPYWHAVKVPGVWAGPAVFSMPILPMIQSFDKQYKKRPGEIFTTLFNSKFRALVSKTNLKRYF